uniref:Major facilitator superfamily MFS_1 n=1 Tax=uncultured bacterium contig00004 TaxID=1181496 RepID=A0A806KJF2_9BACT|nr:major facilitator superfamily MFS_1 [uncultured bacterium contig00004]
MLAMGLSDTKVGFLVTVCTISQMIFSFLSGPLTDKLGRRRATAIFDILAWSIPALIWWRAENFWFFLAAAVLNGSNGVTQNSWHCLAIEDAEKKQITDIYSIVMACAQMSALFAPITAILISRLTLVPAIRILFINGFILMTLKVVILYLASKETSIGKMRMQETKGKNVFRLAGGYSDVIKIILGSRGTVFSIVIAAVAWIVQTINNTFWQIIANKKLLVPEAALPLFMVLRSILAIIFLFFVIPRLAKGLLKVPLLLGFAAYFVGQAILLMVPVEGVMKYPLLCLSLVFDGFGIGILGMLSESLIALHVNPNERARIMALRFMMIMMVTAPFGWIAGFLSDISRNLPFVLNLFILILGIAITLFYYHHKDSDHSAERMADAKTGSL